MYIGLWRNGGITPNIFGLDAKCLFPFIPFLLHITMWTFVTAVVSTLFFWVLSYKGYSIDIALMRIRCWLIGEIRTYDSDFDKITLGYY